MPTKPQYIIIPPDDVRPGDIYKFTPLGGGRPHYHRVVAVCGAFVEIETSHNGVKTTTYTPKSHPQVTFGRRIQ